MVNVIDSYVKEQVKHKDFPKIADIHNIPVYGRLPGSHLSSLSKVESITRPNEWEGIKGIYCTDFVNSIGTCAAYVTCKDPTEPVKINMDFKDWSKGYIEFKDSELPIIVLSSFKDEYAFAICVVHELGHHVYEDNSPERQLLTLEELEVNAHLYAMQRVSRKKFKCITEPNFYFWKQARQEYIKRFGYDSHISGDYSLREYLANTIDKFKSVFKKDWITPKTINNPFAKIIKWESFEPAYNLPSPWRMDKLTQ